MDEKLRRYADSRATTEGAKSYETKYDRYWHKRLSSRREHNLLRRLLDQAGRQARVLDVPSGAGRLSPVFAEYAQDLVEADYSPQMLQICRGLHLPPQSGFVRVNALELPFADRSFDLVISVRLSHHIGDNADRERHLKELLRVSDRWVLMSFFDHNSFKNLLRRMRGTLFRTAEKRTLKLRQVLEMAAEAGFKARDHAMLSWTFSGHRFILLERV